MKQLRRLKKVRVQDIILERLFEQDHEMPAIRVTEGIPADAVLVNILREGANEWSFIFHSEEWDELVPGAMVPVIQVAHTRIGDASL